MSPLALQSHIPFIVDHNPSVTITHTPQHQPRPNLQTWVGNALAAAAGALPVLRVEQKAANHSTTQHMRHWVRCSVMLGKRGTPDAHSYKQRS